MDQFLTMMHESHIPDMHGALPIYIQLAEVISREIRAGHLAEGERLPTEREMAKQYGVAVGTLRKALDKLTQQGLLDRRHGSGNYVRKFENSGSIYAFLNLEKPSGGGLPTAKLLDMTTMEKPKFLPDFGSSSFAHRFRRLRFLDGHAVALEEIWLDGSVAKTIDTSVVSQSLYHFFSETLGLWILRVEDWIGVDQVPDWEVDQFLLSSGKPAGFIERFGWAAGRKPIEYSRTWFDPNSARYVSRLK
jgi:GntR family transcriptional regulator